MLERRRIIQEARADGSQAVVLEPFFAQEYRATGRTLEIPQDGHWNVRGHEIVANQIAAALGIPQNLTKYDGAPVVGVSESVPKIASRPVPQP